MTRLVVHGERVLLGTGPLRDGHVVLAGDRIAAAAPGPPPPAAGGPRLELGRRILAPGFVDLHVHGGGGGDLLAGGAADIARAVAFHARHGTTALVATTVSASPGALLAAVRRLAAAGERPAPGARLLGVHLEGPYLAPRRRGAHELRHLRPPDPAELERLLEAGGGAVRMVTLAPELPGAAAAMAAIARSGAVPALGHSEASFDTAQAAIAAGARHAVHLFNAMGPLHHRTPGLAGAALAAPEVTCELIADGRHLHPAVLALAARLKGPAGAALVTDAIPAAGLPDGRHRLGGLEIDVRDGTARVAGAGTLAGSTLTMDRAVRGAVEEAGIPLDDALRMASSTPAAVLGLEHRLGRLAAGREADLVVLDERLGVTATMIAGRWLGGPPV
jgi:N-acetylglucosamine-6-phosphate deacetylase